MKMSAEAEESTFFSTVMIEENRIHLRLVMEIYGLLLGRMMIFFMQL
jgi:hypothetical protein